MLCVAGVIAYNVLTANARGETEAQAKMITDYAGAARTYTDAQIAPVSLSNRNGVFRSQWIPFYAATQIFSYVHASYPDYTYKEAALNPTNQRDRAVDWEAEIIDAFRDNPSLKSLSGERPLLAGSALYVASPIVATADCLSCHGSPSAAPRGMAALYGTNNGFGWKNGEIIGAEIVSVPMTVPLDMAREAFAKMMIALVDDGDAAGSGSHDRPFRLLVPMKLSNAVRAEPHVDACDRLGNREAIHANLPRPTAVLDSLGRKIEGGPKLRHAVDVGRRRVLEGGLVACKARVLRPWVD